MKPEQGSCGFRGFHDYFGSVIIESRTDAIIFLLN